MRTWEKTTSSEAVIFLDQRPVGRHPFQKGATYVVVLDPGRPPLQEAAGRAQHLCGAAVVSLQDPVAGPVDAEGLVGAVEAMGLQMLEDLIGVDHGLRWLSTAQGQAGQPGQGVAQDEGRIPLTEVVTRRSILQRLLSAIAGRLVVAFGVVD
jgi:hypothetical protein